MEETQNQTSANPVGNQLPQAEMQSQTPMQQPPVDSQPQPSSGNTMKYLAVTLVILVVVGIVIYVVTQGSSSNRTYTSPVVTPYPSPTVVPTIAQSQEEQDVSKIEVGSVDSDLQDLDNDLTNLSP